MRNRTYLSMWVSRSLFYALWQVIPGRESRGIVSLLRLRSRKRETMVHFSSKPLTTKYRPDTQETSILPKAPLFLQAVCHDHCFIYSYYDHIHSPRNEQRRSSGPPKPLLFLIYLCAYLCVCKVITHIISNRFFYFQQLFLKAKEACVRLFLS